MLFDTVHEKIEFRKKRGQIQGSEKKIYLGELTIKMITNIEISDSSTCFLIPYLKKLNFGEKGSNSGGPKKKIRCSVRENYHQN